MLYHYSDCADGSWSPHPGLLYANTAALLTRRPCAPFTATLPDGQPHGLGYGVFFPFARHRLRHCLCSRTQPLHLPAAHITQHSPLARPPP